MPTGVRKRSDNSYEIRWDSARGDDGKRRQKSKTVTGTQRQAVAERDRMKVEELKSPAQRKSEKPVEQVCQRFLKRRQIDLRPTTLTICERLFRNYLIPECGSMPIGTVANDDLQGVIDRMVRSGLASSTIHTNHAYLRLFFNWTVRREILLSSPVKDLDLPALRRKSPADIFSPSEAVKVLALLEGSHCWLPTFLALHGGLRPGEVLGLCWDDVDLVAGKLSIKHTLVVDSDGARLGPPKTASSERTVAISPEVVEALRERQQDIPDRFWFGSRKQIGDRMKYIGEPIDFRQACALPDGKVLVNAKWRELFGAKIVDAGIRWRRLHDLRHTHASLMLLDGWSTLAVSRRLGHTSVKVTTDLYGHLLPDTDSDTAARFGQILMMAT